jgi:hypothetical protein
MFFKMTVATANNTRRAPRVTLGMAVVAVELEAMCAGAMLPTPPNLIGETAEARQRAQVAENIDGIDRSQGEIAEAEARTIKRVKRRVRDGGPLP